MKPVRLVVQAFGPYADVQVFDFRDLGNHTFFLIHGDTGSGKSTILDAICYALYGDSSGGERTGLQLRSHHAPLSRRTIVRFDFAIGTDLYRIFRSPEHERPKQRGVGMAIDPQAARLWIRTGSQDDDQAGEILAERWEQVNNHVITLLGFECSQFRQVVILPQGQFRDFLIASSGDREAILSVLFKTDEFRNIELALKEAANRIKRNYDRQTQRLIDLYQRAAVKDNTALQQERIQRVTELASLTGQVETFRAVADEAQQQLQEGQEAQRKINEWGLAKQTADKLDAQQAEFDTQRIERDQGRLAATLADIEITTNQRLAEVLQADLEFEQARQYYDSTIVIRTQVREALTLAEQRQPEIDQVRQQLMQLHEIAAKIDGMEEAHANLANAEQQVRVLAKQRLDLDDACGEAEAILQTQNQTTAKYREITAQGEARQLRFEHVQRLYQQRERLDVIFTALIVAEQDEQSITELHDNAVATYEAAQQIFEQVEHALVCRSGGYTRSATRSRESLSSVRFT